MNDATFNPDPSAEPFVGAEIAPQQADPQFGAVDIVEAFTALRHEWRGQTKEGRALAEQIQAATANLQALESKLLAAVADCQPDVVGEGRRLALVIAETDHQLSRAVAAVLQWETSERQREEADERAIDRRRAEMTALARWFARPLLQLLAERRAARPLAARHPAAEGLEMVLARLRRMMREQGLERIDVLGEPFDADSMHAIGTMTAANCPPGHVGEQLSAAYCWRGQRIRFADVRVARQPPDDE
jgi:molecular chaperone GrpE